MYCIFKDGVQDITFENNLYIHGLEIGPYCRYLTITGSTQGQANLAKHYNIHSGVCGTSIANKTITLEATTNEYNTELIDIYPIGATEMYI